MNHATSHARSRVRLAVGIGACLAMAAPKASAQPGPAMPYGQLSLPPLHDGSHDFDFLEGAWRFRQGRLVRPLSGPGSPMRESTGRLVGRTPAVGSATVEWETTPPDSTRVSGFARMSYDPKSREWTIWEAESRTAPPESPLVGHFENGVGAFYGLRQHEGRTVIVHLSWRIRGLGHAEFQRSFSTDGGAAWETHWIMHLSRESTRSPPRVSREAACCGNVEVVWYTVPPGKDEELTRLFARESFAMGDSTPVQDIALLRDIDHPATFVLVRGFDWGRSREFYDGLPWAAHRATLRSAQIRADSVWELRADLLSPGFALGERLTPGRAAGDPGVVVATMYVMDQRRVDSYTFGMFFIQSVVPRLIATKARLVGVFANDNFQIGDLWTGQQTVSAIPGRPLPARRSGFVWFAWFPDTAAYERHRQALEADPFWRDVVAPRLAEFVTSIATSSRLVPVGRSREFRNWLEGFW